ncbi:MAG TPA: hypothetical protein DDW50_08910 [Firmicutes bacterium]|jgi:hypothetical protein|nr:hypothetical protein [Bacillota bacterium]
MAGSSSAIRASLILWGFFKRANGLLVFLRDFGVCFYFIPREWKLLSLCGFFIDVKMNADSVCPRFPTAGSLLERPKM